MESCRESEKWNVRFVKSIDPEERDKFFGDNDESDEIVVENGGGGDDDDEGDRGYRVEVECVLNDEDNELLLSRRDNGGGGGGCGVGEVNSWNEVLIYNPELIWFVGGDELVICFCGNEKLFRRARIVDGDSFDSSGIALSLKSTSLNTSNIFLSIS